MIECLSAYRISIATLKMPSSVTYLRIWELEMNPTWNNVCNVQMGPALGQISALRARNEDGRLVPEFDETITLGIKKMLLIKIASANTSTVVPPRRRATEFRSGRYRPAPSQQSLIWDRWFIVDPDIARSNEFADSDVYASGHLHVFRRYLWSEMWYMRLWHIQYAHLTVRRSWGLKGLGNDFSVLCFLKSMYFSPFFYIVPTFDWDRHLSKNGL